MRFEYTVVPAPARGVKARGVKTPEARFALALQETMNEMAAQGWEYQRAETLPSVERAGLTGSTTNWRHVLVFRRLVEENVTTATETGAPLAGDEPEITDASEDLGADSTSAQSDTNAAADAPDTHDEAETDPVAFSHASETRKTPEGSDA